MSAQLKGSLMALDHLRSSTRFAISPLTFSASRQASFPRPPPSTTWMILDRLQLVTAMQDEFDIEIDDDKLMAINSVAQAIDAIEQTLEA